jgi:hypothetical protein
MGYVDIMMGRKRRCRMKRCKHSNYNKVAMTNICDINCEACAGYRRKCDEKDDFERSVSYVK